MAGESYNLSRTEEMLNAMIDGGSYSTGYIQSRVEKILQAIIDGTPYTDEPQSRIEALLIQILEGGGGGGGKETLNALIDGSITEIVSDIETIRKYAFYRLDNLVSISLPNVKTISQYGINNCKVLQEVKLPNVTKIEQYGIGSNAILEILDLPKVNDLYSGAFGSCSKLATVILRYNEGVVNLQNYDAFNSTLFAANKAGGKLYVPQARIAAYQAHTQWARVFNNNPNNQILAIENSIYE